MENYANFPEYGFVKFKMSLTDNIFEMSPNV